MGQRSSYMHLHSTMFIFICYFLPESFFCLDNLHSTMFIFILQLVFLSSSFFFQFTFHYVYIYIKRGKRDNKIKSIYIPLCLYLYNVFSFCNAPVSLFTFHYVYIYIDSIPDSDYAAADLHSTMFIFIFALRMS